MMPVTNFEKVIQFMNTYGQEVKRKAEFPDKTTTDLRVELIEEELGELKEAIENNDLVEVADALTDILYVVYGAGAAFGINLDVCFNEVHSSNRSKLDKDGKPIYREDGKIMKGPNYSEPDLKTIVSNTND